MSTNSQSAFCTRSAVCSLHFVPSQHFYPVCSLHSVLTRLVLLFLSERASSPDRNIGARKEILETILAAMIDVWTVCWRAPEEEHNDRAMITLYQLRTDANARFNNMVASDTLLCGHSVCWNESDTGPLGVNISASRFIKPYEHFSSFRVSLWASSVLIWLLLRGEG